MHVPDRILPFFVICYSYGQIKFTDVAEGFFSMISFETSNYNMEKI